MGALLQRAPLFAPGEDPRPVARQVVVIASTTQDMGVFDGLQALELYQPFADDHRPLTV